MNKKGVSPVVQIILLLALTVVSVVVVYTQINQLTQIPSPQKTDAVPPYGMYYPYYTASYNGSNGTHVRTKHCTHFSVDNKTCWHTVDPLPESTNGLEYRGELTE